MPTIFDHIKNIVETKGEYLGDDNWNIYMINRYISMIDADHCELVSSLQKNLRPYSFIPNEVQFNIYKELIPKRNSWIRYIKSTNKDKYKIDELKAIADAFEISTKEARDYVDITDKKDLKHFLQQIQAK